MSSDLYSSNSETNRLDQPSPVTLYWEGTATDVEIFSDEGRTVPVLREDVTDGESVEIYNLIPGREYWYSSYYEGDVVAEGHFTVSGRRRMMKVCSKFAKEYAANCRDLGGLKTVNGKSLKYGMIYRGSNIDKFKHNLEMREVLLNVMGIKLDVDLRNDDQIRQETASDIDLSEYGIGRNYQDYGYMDQTDLENPDKVRATLTSIMTSVCRDEPVYIHCSIGSDRTGYFCLLIEALLGVRQLWTDTDYELTSFASSVTSGARLRTETQSSSNKYKCGLLFISGFSGNTLSEKVYDYVVTSESEKGLHMDASLVDDFISRMQQ